MITTDFLSSCYKTMIQQEQSIPRTLKNVPEGQENILRNADRVILTGAGDSLAVAEYGALLLQELGIHAIALTPTVVNRLPISTGDLLVGITASGRSLSTIDALQHARKERATSVVLTDNPDGNAANLAETVWTTVSGADTYDIIPTAPTTTAMAFLLGLVSRLDDRLDREIEKLLDGLSSIMDWAESRGEEIAGRINLDGVVCFLSEGENLVAAHIGVMKLNESALVRGVLVLREEFEHHGNLPAREEDFVILISDTPNNERDFQYMEVLTEQIELQAYNLHLPERYQIAEPAVQALGNTIAMQMMGYYLILEHNPSMEWFRMPNAKAFRIY